MRHEWAEAATIGDLLLRTAASAPERDALVFPDQRVSYGELAAAARRVARGLIGAGVRPGGRVASSMANSPETVAAFYGTALAGAVIVPINTRYRSRELPFVLGNAGVKVILTSDRIGDYVDLRGLLEEARVDQAIFEWGDNEAELSAPADDVPGSELDARRIAVRIGST